MLKIWNYCLSSLSRNLSNWKAVNLSMPDNDLKSSFYRNDIDILLKFNKLLYLIAAVALPRWDNAGFTANRPLYHFNRPSTVAYMDFCKLTCTKELGNSMVQDWSPVYKYRMPDPGPMIIPLDICLGAVTLTLMLSRVLPEVLVPVEAHWSAVLTFDSHFLMISYRKPLPRIRWDSWRPVLCQATFNHRLYNPTQHHENSQWSRKSSSISSNLPRK